MAREKTVAPGEGGTVFGMDKEGRVTSDTPAGCFSASSRCRGTSRRGSARPSSRKVVSVTLIQMFSDRFIPKIRIECLLKILLSQKLHKLIIITTLTVVLC